MARFIKEQKEDVFKPRLLFLLVGLAFSYCAPQTMQAQQRVNELLVSTDWLEENLTDSSLVILHYGMKTAYDNEHIPGARYVQIWDLLVDTDQGPKHELPDENKIEQALRTLGINNNSTIALCYEDGNAIPMAARLFYTLDYAGLGDQVVILNGGLAAWKTEGRSLTTSGPAHKEGKVDIKIKEEVRVSKTEVFACLQKEGVVIVDARPEEQYYGISENDNSSRQGHIEGAVNLPFFQLKQEDSIHLFKSKEELYKMFGARNIKEGTRIITYCGSGIWASPVYFVSRYLGYEVALYDGSFQEWAKDPSLPVSKTSTKPKPNMH